MGYSKYFEDIEEERFENMKNRVFSQQGHPELRSASRRNAAGAAAVKSFSRPETRKSSVPRKAGGKKWACRQTDKHLIPAKRLPGPEIVKSLDYIHCRYNLTSAACNTFLAANPVSFYRERYRLSKTASGSDPDAEKIKALLKGNKALSVDDICRILTREHKDKNICLGDLVYFASILRRNKDFAKAEDPNRNNLEIQALSNFAENLDCSRLHELPVECYGLKWVFVGDPESFIVSAYERSKRENTKNHMAEVIVAQEQRGTAESVARKLLSRYGLHAEPSAYFAAKVFMYLWDLKVLRWERS